MFEYPKVLRQYLDKRKDFPMGGFSENSTYYAEVDYMYKSYMQNIVRPCIAYGSATSDFGVDQQLTSGTGKALVDGITRLVIGDKIFFEGNDESIEFFTDIWANRTQFHKFLVRAERFKYLAGSAICKINTDERGCNYLSAYRLDRTLPSFDDMGNIIGCIFYATVLNELKNDNNELHYWLVEERKYNDKGEKVLIYKVLIKSGIAQAPVIPSPYYLGADYKSLPPNVKRRLKELGVTKLNHEYKLPYKDGLGVWKLDATATNSCMPDVPFGDPLLYGVLDLLWSIDVVYSGSIIDVLNGEGKVIVPKQFLQRVITSLNQSNVSVTTQELDGYGAENFVYVMPTGFEKDTQAPLPVQFDIRGQEYKAMWEMYQKEAIVRTGFSPSSLFPHLAPDTSAKTAREITAEENLTRASVRQAHLLDIPVFNRMLKEVAAQEGLDQTIELKLGDYIGNKLEYDSNMRLNLASGIIPREIAVKMVNNLSVAETRDYLAKIEEDERQRAEINQLGSALFNETDYYGDQKQIKFEKLDTER